MISKAAELELSKVDNMEGHEFERWCASLLKANGFTGVTVTQGSGDQGADIIAWNGGEKYIIQCKRYSGRLGNKPIQEAYTAKSIYDCHNAVVMTNNFFTDGAYTAAKSTGVRLWGRGELARMLQGMAYKFQHQEEAFERECQRLKQSGVKDYDLWPHNQFAIDIDVKYFRNLPHVELHPGMMEYVRMKFEPVAGFCDPVAMNKDIIVGLQSEPLSSADEAYHFAKAIEKHCYGITRADGNIVYGRFHLYSIITNWRDEIDCFLFPNWA